MAKSSTAVAKKDTTAVAVAEDIIDFFEDAGAGMEGADKDSFAIPFLAILQKMSPQVDEADGAFIEGAKPGQFLNTVTKEFFDGKVGVTFLQSAYQRRFLRWGAKKLGGGFKGEYLPEVAAALIDEGKVVNVDGKLLFPLDDGTLDPDKCDALKDTRHHFGILLDEETGATQEVLLSLSSTQIKKSKAIMSVLNGLRVPTPSGKMVNPPTWMTKLRLTTVSESNEKGSWSGLSVANAGLIQSQEVYAAGKKFHEAINAGTGGKVVYEDESVTGDDSVAPGKF